MTSPSYEFTAEQNETFKGLVRNMKRSGIVVAIASLILFAYQMVEHFGISLGGRPNEAVYYLDLTIWCLLSGVGVVMAVLLVRATSAFTAVIHTEGNDVEHLMQGLTRLRDILQLLSWAATAGSLLLAVSFALLLVYA
jgi:uncharacterized membrane protein